MRKLFRALAGITLLGVFATPVAASCGGMEVHAHRGAGPAPENSVRALSAALQAGFDGYETDIQQLRTGEWVMHHDLTTGRVVVSPSGAVRGPGEMDRAEWAAARMKNRQGAATNEPAPFLADVVAATRPLLSSRGVANIEIKGAYQCNAIRQAYELVKHGLPEGSWFFTAIDKVALKCLRTLDAQQYIGLIASPEIGDDQMKKAEAVANKFGKFGAAALEKTKGKYEASLNREYLSEDGLARMKRAFGNAGLHADVASISPSLLKQAQKLGIPVFTYSREGDTAHAAKVLALNHSTQLWPSGVVIDGDAQAFCLSVHQKGR